jgi:hypothetical protein
MKKKDLIFVAIAVSVIGLFIFLSLIGRKPKPLAVRAEHAGVSRETSSDDCLACHAPDSTVAPMPPRHPKKGRPPDKTTPCYACHKYPESAVAILMTKREGEFLWLNRQER